MTLKLEVGKWYKTRGGKKAYVGLQTPNPEWMWDEFSGYVEMEGGCESCQWSASGAFKEDMDSILDLVSEWREPRSITVDVYFVEVDGQEHSYTLKSGVPARLGAKILGKRLGITINEGDGMEEKQCSANW